MLSTFSTLVIKVESAGIEYALHQLRKSYSLLEYQQPIVRHTYTSVQKLSLTWSSIDQKLIQPSSRVYFKITGIVHRCCSVLFKYEAY